jgi:hypothetical protein
VFAPVEECGFSHGQPCSSCRRMDKHMPELERFVDEKQKTGRDKTRAHGRKTKAKGS